MSKVNRQNKVDVSFSLLMFTQRHSAQGITLKVFVFESRICIFLLRNNVFFISLQSKHPYLIRCEQNESCDGCKNSCFNYSVLIIPPMKHWLQNFPPSGNSLKIYQSFLGCMGDIQVHNNWSIKHTVFPSLTCSFLFVSYSICCVKPLKWVFHARWNIKFCCCQLNFSYSERRTANLQRHFEVSTNYFSPLYWKNPKACFFCLSLHCEYNPNVDIIIVYGKRGEN